MTDYSKLIAALSAAGVDYVVVGGLAATAHGSARFTQDVDVVYRRNDANVARLVSALRPLDPYLRGAPRGLPFVWDEVTVRNGLNFTLITTAGAIDLLGEIAGGTYETLNPHAIGMTVAGRSCAVLDLPELIRVKRAAGRPKDLEAIAELEALLEERGGR